MKRHALAVLAALNGALVLVLAALWLGPDGHLRNTRWTAPAAIANDYLHMLPSLPPRQPVDASRFLALLERPLFQPTRRPPPPPPPPSAVVQAAPVDNLSTAQLSGVVAGEGGASIIITLAGKARRVRLNESVDGWTLQSIQGRSVVFVGGGQTRTLQLPRAALTNSAGTAPVPALPLAVPPMPAAAIEPPAASAAQVAPPPAPAAPPANTADAAPKPPRRPRFSSGPQ